MKTGDDFIGDAPPGPGRQFLFLVVGVGQLPLTAEKGEIAERQLPEDVIGDKMLAEAEERKRQHDPERRLEVAPRAVSSPVAVGASLGKWRLGKCRNKNQPFPPEDKVILMRIWRENGQLDRDSTRVDRSGSLPAFFSKIWSQWTENYCKSWTLFSF